LGGEHTILEEKAMHKFPREVSAEELARILAISEFTVKKLVKEKQIPYCLRKGRYRFNLAAIFRFFRRLEGGAA
jgi:hypothetical protein